MPLAPATKRFIQIALAVALVAVTARTGYILYERSQAEKAEDPKSAGQPKRVLKMDDYVYLKPLNAFDFQTAKKLEGMTVWVRAGNAVTYFEGKKEAGQLPPNAKLKMGKLFRQGDQMLANFSFEGDDAPKGNFSVPIGAQRGESVNIIVDQLFYYEDPKKLYSHWPKEMWDAIDRGEIVKGMSEIQAGMAMGAARSVGSGSEKYGDRTLDYTHKGKSLRVTFVENTAVRVEEVTLRMY